MSIFPRHKESTLYKPVLVDTSVSITSEGDANLEEVHINNGIKSSDHLHARTRLTKDGDHSEPALQNPGHDTLLKQWWRETICCMFALAALLAIVATIYTHEGKSIPRWNFGLTINAAISIYILIIKAAAGLVLAEGIGHLKWVQLADQPQPLSTFVAHDNASRGPKGSLELLWKNRYYTRKLRALPFVSSFGALLTIFVLLLDPFSQQIVRTNGCFERVPTNATIARTNYYNEVSCLLTRRFA